MKKCWHKDPPERPSAEDLFYLLGEWIINLENSNSPIFSNAYQYEDLEIETIKPTENSLMFLNADQEMKKEDFQLSELSLDEPIHSEASLISKPLPLLPFSQNRTL